MVGGVRGRKKRFAIHAKCATGGIFADEMLEQQRKKKKKRNVKPVYDVERAFPRCGTTRSSVRQRLPAKLQLSCLQLRETVSISDKSTRPRRLYLLTRKPRVHDFSPASSPLRVFYFQRQFRVLVYFNLLFRHVRLLLAHTRVHLTLSLQSTRRVNNSRTVTLIRSSNGKVTCKESEEKKFWTSVWT